MTDHIKFQFPYFRLLNLKNIKLYLWALLGLLSALWLLAIPAWPDVIGVFSLRPFFLQYTGIIATGVMSAAMLLATRPHWLEPFLNGLDKSYRLHKWLGITALIASVAHWLWKEAPKWAVNLGLLAQPDRKKPPKGDAVGWVDETLRMLRDPAEFVGEWGFYIAVALILVALITYFSYRFFTKTHWWFSILYLVLVFHSVILMDTSYWTQPIGIAMGVLMATGVVSAVLLLFNLAGKKHQSHGTIKSLEYYKEMEILETTIQLDDRWRGHRGGQFAFVTFDEKEGSHPFTIASAWTKEDRSITFITKGLGSHTKLLPERLQIGDQVKIEGPYGEFAFTDGNKRQIWISGGIGITPFIARMKQLALDPHDYVIDFFHTSKNVTPPAKAKLDADVANSKVQLHLLISGKDDRLDGAKLRETIPDWQTASIWFCGPSNYGNALRDDLITNGLSAKDFHQELFNFR